ncbi:MAG TPA: CAP domain-containing protein [Trebonia sp.]|nr:CAP domain-containing protein [Trebonia sp.]
MTHGTPAPPASPRRARIAAAAALALAALIGGSLYLARGAFSPGPSSAGTVTSSRATVAGCGAADASPCASAPAAMAVAAAPVVVTVPPRHPAAGPRRASAAPSASAMSPTMSAPPSPSVTASPAASPADSPTADQDGAPAARVLALINQARSTAGLPALTLTAGLETTSSAHNLLMAGGCGLSHQCQGEPAIGDRETAAGVHWTAAGENIGEGGPVADTSAAIAAMAVGLTQSMLNEKPPDDGHRLNILSTAFTHVGIAVYRDSSGTVWLTQDFSN